MKKLLILSVVMSTTLQAGGCFSCLPCGSRADQWSVMQATVRETGTCSPKHLALVARACRLQVYLHDKVANPSPTVEAVYGDVAQSVRGSEEATNALAVVRAFLDSDLANERAYADMNLVFQALNALIIILLWSKSAGRQAYLAQRFWHDGDGIIVPHKVGMDWLLQHEKQIRKEMDRVITIVRLE